MWRIRVGDYRVLYEIHDDRLVVVMIRVGDQRDVHR
jgi:mRNA interferase RelE/StbE